MGAQERSENLGVTTHMLIMRHLSHFAGASNFEAPMSHTAQQSTAQHLVTLSKNESQVKSFTSHKKVM